MKGYKKVHQVKTRVVKKNKSNPEDKRKSQIQKKLRTTPQFYKVTEEEIMELIEKNVTSENSIINQGKRILICINCT